VFLGRHWLPTLLLAGSAIAQQEHQFRVDAANVTVEVVVTDKRGKPVTGLTAESFHLSQDGARQNILRFEPPVSAATSSSETSSSTTEASGQQFPRSYVSIVIDQANTGASARKATVKALRDYLGRGLGEDAFISLYAVGSGLKLILPFTRDKQALGNALSKYFDNPNDGAFTTSDKSQLDQQTRQLIDQERRAAASDPSRAEALRAQRMALQTAAWAQTALQVKALFAALRAIAQASGTLRGSKSIILFSEGFNHAPEARAGSALVIDAANHTNTTIYAIDPSGLGTATVESSTAAEFGSNETAGGPGRSSRRTVPNTVNEQMKEVADSARRRPTAGGDHSDPFDTIQHISIGIDLGGIADLAENTGGFLIKGQNDILRALGQINTDTRNSYKLVYQPHDLVYDGRFRKITVQVAGGSYQLRYRRGYYALAPTDFGKLTPAAAQLLASVTSGALRPSVEMKLNAAVLFGAETNFDVPVSLRAATQARHGMLIITVRDYHGALLDASQSTLAETDRDENNNVRVFSCLNVTSLDAAEVTALIVFMDGTAAFATRHLDPAPLADSTLQLTTAVLTDQVQTAVRVPTVLDSLKVGEYQLILPPELRFARTDALTLFLGLENAGPEVSVEMAVKSQGETALRTRVESLHTTQSPGRTFVLKQFRVSSLPPGIYTLEIWVQNRPTEPRLLRSVAFQLL
jgi:VWFA-related protein